MCLRVFVEQETKDGCGTGKLRGKQMFVCRRDFALFVPIEAVIPEEDFDENPVNARSTRTSERDENVEEQIHKDEPQAKSISYDGCFAGKVPFKIHLNSFEPYSILEREIRVFMKRLLYIVNNLVHTFCLWDITNHKFT